MFNAGICLLKIRDLGGKCRHSAVKSSKYRNIMTRELLTFSYLQFRRQGMEGASDQSLLRACGVPPAQQIKLVWIFNGQDQIKYIKSKLHCFAYFPVDQLSNCANLNYHKFSIGIICFHKCYRKHQRILVVPLHIWSFLCNLTSTLSM